MKLCHLREFFAPLRAYPGMTLARMGISFYTSLAFIVNVEIFRRFIQVIETGGGKESALEYAAVSAAVTFSAFALNISTWKWHWAHLYANYWRFVADKYLRRYLLLDNEETSKLGTGNAVGIIDRAFEALLDSLSEHGVDMFEKSVRYVLGICLVGYLNPALVVPLLVATVGFGAFAYWINAKILILRMARNEAQTDIFARTVRIVMEKFTIMKNGKIESEIAGMEPLFAKWENLGLKVDRRFVWMDYFPQFVIDLWRISVLAYMAYQTVGGQFSNSVADFTAVLLVTGFLSEYAFSVVKSYQNISREATYVWRLADMFESLPAVEGYDTGGEFDFKHGKVDIENVTFSYKRGSPALKGFSLTVDGGKKVALVGRSGAGKTTVVKLLLGFVRPQSGTVSVDGQDLRSVSLKSYYRHVGYLPQEPAVFDGTVLENLAYGLPDGTEASESEIRSALASAQCEFVDRMPEGLSTQIGEKGVRLSGGERQRLAIARLFLQNPKIVVLDEPTAALDSFSEAKISEALDALCEGRTFVVIAHRLQTVKGADEIVVMENGRIEERGTHDELVAKGGGYARMVELQSGLHS